MAAAQQDTEAKKYSHCVAIPMSSVPQELYESYKGVLVQLCTLLGRGDRSKVFCAALGVEGVNFDSPGAAFLVDTKAIEQSDHFIMIVPSNANSSITFEAGYAAAKGVPVTIFCKQLSDLVYILRFADTARPDQFKIHTYSDPADILAHCRAA